MNLWEWQAALRRSPLPRCAKTVGLELSTYGSSTGLGIAPSQEQICKDFGHGIRFVTKGVRALHEGGFVNVLSTTKLDKNKHRPSNRYTLTLPLPSQTTPNVSNDVCTYGSSVSVQPPPVEHGSESHLRSLLEGAGFDLKEWQTKEVLGHDPDLVAAWVSATAAKAEVGGLRSPTGYFLSQLRTGAWPDGVQRPAPIEAPADDRLLATVDEFKKALREAGVRPLELRADGDHLFVQVEDTDANKVPAEFEGYRVKIDAVNFPF